MQVYHNKTLTVPDAGIASVVGPNDWNSTHLVDIVLSGHTLGSSVVSGTQIIFNAGPNITISADTANSQIIFSGGAGGGGGGIAIADSVGTISNNTVVFANSNSVSFGLNGSTITASIPAFQSQGAYLTTAMRSDAVTLSNIRVSGGTTSNLLSALTFADSNGVSFGLNAGTLTATVVTNYQPPGAYLTTAALSQDSSKYAGTGTSFGGTNISGSMTMNTAGLTLSMSVAAPGGGGGTTNQTGPNIADGAGNTITSGTVVFSNSNNVSFGLNGSTMTASIPSLTAFLTTAMQSNAVTLSNIRVSGGTTSNLLSAITFADSNGVSFGLNAGTLTATVATNYQSQGAYLTTARASNDAIGLNTAQSNVTWTANSSGVSLDARGYAGTGTTIATAGGIGASATMDSNGLNISLTNNNTLSRFVPMDFFPALSASSSAGVATMHLFPFVLPAPMSFGQINMLGAIGTVTTAPGNTFTLSQSIVSSLGFSYSAAHSATKFIDIFLFSRGSGAGTTNLSMFASTENQMLSFNSFTMAVSATAAAANSTASYSISQTHSYAMSMPGMTSQTMTSVNAASTVTTWGTANMSYGTSASASTSNTGNTTSTYSSSIAATFASTTIFSGNHMIPFQFATSLTPGEYWLGMLQRSSTSSGSTTAINNNVAGNSLSFAINGSVFTTIGAQVYSSVGMTSTIASSLGWLGSATAATMAVQPGHGSFSATYTTNSTYVNNLGQASGVIALSQINSNVSFWRPWFELAKVRN